VKEGILTIFLVIFLKWTSPIFICEVVIGNYWDENMALLYSGGDGKLL
jgi:hypothetical protein